MKGIYTNMSDRAYHASQAMSRSQLVKVRNNPFKYYYEFIAGHQKPESDSYDLQLGRAAHVLAFKPDEFADQFQEVPDTFSRTRNADKETEKQANACGKEVIKSRIKAQAQAMADNLRAFDYFKDIDIVGYNEVTAFAEIMQLSCKIKADRVNPPFIFDFKTIANLSIKSIRYAIKDFGYDMQAAFYIDVWNAVSNEPCDTFVDVYVEKTPPFCVWPIAFDETLIQRGREKYQEAIEIYKRCVANDEWPGFCQELLTMTAEDVYYE